MIKGLYIAKLQRRRGHVTAIVCYDCVSRKKSNQTVVCNVSVHAAVWTACTSTMHVEDFYYSLAFVLHAHFGQHA